MARTELYSAASYRAAVMNRFLAEAGVERGIMEMMYRSANMGIGQQQQQQQQQNIVLDEKQLVRVDGRPYSGKMEKGEYTYRITDESGKIGLNALTDNTGILLKNLIINMGYPQEVADTVLDSLLDWRDQDENHRLNGAESDYYMSLPNPYKAKNRDLDAVEELLLVKGVTPVMLYGDGKRKGIINFLTVSSSTTTININAAPKEVLLAVPGMTPEKVDLILKFREAAAIQNIQELALGGGTTAGGSAAAVSSYLGTADSTVFCIEATGNREGGQRGYGIKAIVSLDGPAGYRYLYYKSPAQVEP
ncbi:MAG: general secretion pathway protein GspK, partial [Syntrophales bacterium LBB04]|nr:general secretion pathway protein GspK [Syntrophales bacterium LBB04]